MNPEHQPPPPVDSANAETAARRLLKLLRGTSADRNLSPEQRHELLEAVAEIRDTDLAPIGFLVETLQEMIAHGAVTVSDFTDLYCALERVVPVTTTRLVAIASRRALPPPAPPPVNTSGDWSPEKKPDASAVEPSPGIPDWRRERISDAQLEFIKRFCLSLSANATQGEAAGMIERLLAELPLSHRQQVMCKFWTHAPRTDDGPREVLAWMEGFFREDPDRRKAWQLFRLEHRRIARPEDAAGAGPTYLAQIKAGRVVAPPRPAGVRPRSVGDPTQPTARPRWPLVAAGGALLLFAAVAAMVVRKKYPPAAVRPADASESAGTIVGTQSTDPASQAAAKIKVVGIIQGEEPRALIDGKLYLVGEVVDIQHGIKVVWIDAKKETVDFVDAQGHIFRRSLR